MTGGATTMEPEGTDDGDGATTIGAGDCPPVAATANPPRPVCVAYVAMMVDCETSFDPACIDYHEHGCEHVLENAAAASPACAAANEDLYACLSRLTCRELVAGTACDDELLGTLEPCNPG